MRGSVQSRGFTLLELLLAVAVFAIVLTAINGVFFAALKLRNKTAESFEQALPLEQTLSILRRDLTGLMPPGGTFGGVLQTTTTTTGSQMETAGRRVSPDFYTTTGAIDEYSPYGEVQKVGYFLANPTNQTPGFELLRVTSRNLLPVNVEEIEPQLLLSGVQTMTVLFYDGLNWTELWDSTTTSNLPSAIKVQILMVPPEGSTRAEPPIELVVPVMVQASTNQTATASTGS